MDSIIAKPAPKPTAPAKPAESKTPASPAKPSGDKPPQSVHVEAVKEGPPELRKRLAEIQQKYAGLEKTAANRERELNEKIAAFEKRRYLSPDEQKQYESTLERAKKLEADYYAMNFRESPEFKDKYEAKYAKRAQQALADVKEMKVVVKGPDDQDTVRAATPADWGRVLNANSNPEAARIARELFGEDAPLVLQHREALRQIEEQANEEVENRRKNFDADRQKQFGEFKTKTETHQRIHDEYDAALVQKYPQFFAENPEKPEEVAALRKGIDFVDAALKDTSGNIEEHARKAAVLRRWAGAFPLLVHRINSLEAQLAQQTEDLGKYRESDPGSGGEAPAPTQVEKDIGGTDELAKMIGKGKLP